MNLQHLKIIADQLQFKLTDEPAQRIPSGPGGGHNCWKVKLDKRTFFIKQLDPAIDVNNEKAIARYELCESVAFRFSQQGIPAVYAVKKDKDKYVFILEKTAYLVYPWVEGYSLKRDEVSTKHAVKIAEILADIHNTDLDVPELEPKFDIHTNEKIIYSLEKAFTQKSIAEQLKKNQKMILAINEKYLSAIPTLKEKSVTTHGDVFQHNVIWQDADQPFLIDWEAVKKWNPTREAIRTCLAWGGVTPESSLSLFEVLLNTYMNSGGMIDKNHVEAALNCLYGSIINWLLYNIDLACNSDDDDRKNVAIKEIDNALTSGSKLIRMYPQLYNCINALIK